MARSSAIPKTTAEIKALRIATTTLRGAQLTAKASKARLRALKSEVKIQKQHYKWARKQVRVAKDALAQWRAAAAAEVEAVDAVKTPAPTAKRAKAAGGEGNKSKARPAKREALAIKRLILSPVVPEPAPSAVPAQSAVIAPIQPTAARRGPAMTPGAATSRAE